MKPKWIVYGNFKWRELWPLLAGRKCYICPGMRTISSVNEDQQIANLLDSNVRPLKSRIPQPFGGAIKYSVLGHRLKGRIRP